MTFPDPLPQETERAYLAGQGKKPTGSLGHPQKSRFPTRLLSYVLLALAFASISTLSLVFIYHHVAGRSYFLKLDIFPRSTIIRVIVLLFFYHLFDALRFSYILKTLNARVPFRYLIKLVFINIFISNITPFATGGGFAQIYFLNKAGVSVGAATAATTIRTILAMIFLFTITPVVILTEKNLAAILPARSLFSYLSLLPMIYLFALYMITLQNKMIKRFLYGFLGRLRNANLISPETSQRVAFRIFREINAFSRSIKIFLSGERSYAFAAVLSTLLFLLALFMFSVVLISGLHYEISPFSVISFQVVIAFIMYFAPTPGATGVAEGGYALLFSHFVKKSDIVSLTFAWRFITVYIGMIVGGLIFYMEIRKGYQKRKTDRESIRSGHHPGRPARPFP
ncbi:MAG: flippase-like domain-containing protein [Deltaproteobacteria bacterium]|nr:flippase-like domain-containing protein [Deltaproteobacteria bacterium]